MNNPLSASENTTRNVHASHRGHPAYGNLPPEYLPFLVPHGSGEDLELEFDYEGFLKAQGARKDQEMGGMGACPTTNDGSPAADAGASGDEAEADAEAEGEIAPKAPRKQRAVYSSKEHEQLVRTAVDINPWGAPYRQKGKAWNAVLKSLQDQGMFVGASVGTIRNKLDAMIAWQADNDSTEGRPVNSLSEGTKCVLASLLDRASELKAQAERQSEDDKAKAKAKADEDRVGGETIRAASLATFRKRKRGDETESASDVENDPSPSASKHRRLSRSSSAVRSSFEQQSSGASQQLLDLLSTHQKQQQEFQERVLTQLQENTNRCLRALEDLTAAVVQSLSR